jgi:hypothetical protein
MIKHLSQSLSRVSNLTGPQRRQHLAVAPEGDRPGPAEPHPQFDAVAEMQDFQRI